MIDLASFAAVAVVIGGVAAATARDGRVVVIGLMLAAVTSCLVASPLPGSLAVTARILGAMLAAYLLWAAAASGSIGSAGSAVGLLAESAAALAAFVIGLTIRPVDPLAGPLAAQAAGFALLALAIAPLAGRDVFRMGVGVALLALGCSLLGGTWSGPSPALEQLGMAALLVGIAGATRLLSPALQTESATAASEAPVGWPNLLGEDPVAWPGPARKTGPARPTEPARRTEAARAVPARGMPGRLAPARPEQSSRPETARAPEPARGSEPARGPEPASTPQPAPRKPMTADPLEPDVWSAWAAPEPEPASRSTASRSTGSRSTQPRSTGPIPRTPSSSQATPKKPEPKRPTTRSRPNLGGKP